MLKRSFETAPLTIEDIQKIATLLEIKAGITLKVFSSEFTKEGGGVLFLNPKDVDKMKAVLKPIPPH